MTMTPLDRKAELIRRQKTMAAIAKALNVSPYHVGQVIAGKRRSPRVEQAVAEALDMPLAEVFEIPEAVAC